jgi:DUF4097 and DUF4098 domain-containing protein YvlB
MNQPLSTPPGPLSRIATPGTFRGVAAVAVLAMLGLSMLVVGGCREHPRARYEEQSSTSMALAPQTSLLIENARGSVRLEPGDSGAVRIEAHKRAYGMSEREARKLASEVTVNVDRVGDKMEIHVDYPGHMAPNNVHVEVFGEEVGLHRAEVELVVSVPRGIPTRIETRSANLYVDGTSGPIDFETTSGDAEIDKMEGSFLAHTTSGDINATEILGDVDMNTTSGHFHGKHVGGSLRFDSTSGNLEATDIDGSLTVRTVSGDVSTRRAGGAVYVTTTSGDIVARNVPGDIQIRTSSGDVVSSVLAPMKRIAVETTSGDVRLTLPDPLAGRLDVHTSSGEVSAQIPMKLSQNPTRRQLDGVLGAGDALTSVQTSSGDITISQGGENK